MRIFVFAGLLFLSPVFISLQGCSSSEQKDEALAKKYCGSCHSFPEPSLLDKKTWQQAVLPQMAFLMGLDNTPIWTLTEEDMNEVIKILPPRPMISEQEFQKIKDYYARNAPDLLTIPETEAPKTLTQFEPEEYSLPSPYPSVTHIAFDSSAKTFFIGTRQSMIYKLNSDFNITSSKVLASPLSYIDKSVTPWVFTAMGIMDPNDQMKGELQTLTASLETVGLIDSLKRPVQVSSYDFNRDSRMDYLISEFGNYTGKLTLYEQGKAGFISHPIHYSPGTRRTILTDYDRDGVVDILALVTQGDERIDLYRGHGGFNFTPETIVRFPPVYGSSYFDLVDFNNDGFDDILYTNGDNADYSQILKPYHGVRIFQNSGKGKFIEQEFLPMHGASMAIACDFDQDKDIDIAAIAFFPDFKNSPANGFVYFENVNGKFKRQTTNIATNGRWLTITSADIDHDADQDLILGSLNFTPGVPSPIAAQWQSKNTSLLVLRNKLH